MINNQNDQIPVGYKQTDLGVVPNDWSLNTLGDIAYVTKLAGYEYTNYFNSYKDKGEVIVIRGTNITHNQLDLSDVKTIPRSTSNKLPRSKLEKNDLVFAYVGTIGPVFLIQENNKYHLGPNTCKITPSNSISPDYLLSYFKSELMEKQIFGQTSVGAQPSLSMSKIRSFNLILPKNKEEQVKISEPIFALDSLIAKLSQLIQKKRNIKQGAMQELLTGKRRLPGFSEKWEEKKLGELLTYEQPQKYLVSDTEYDDHFGTPVLTAGKTFILGYTPEQSGIFANLPVIIFDDFTTSSKFVDFPFKAKSSAMKMLLPKYSKVNLRFVFEKMNLIDFALGDHKRYWISEYQNLEVSIPPFKEQTAIAQVLSDMDTEIESLEKQKSKYIDLKQGMMQQLLTGKIRLI